MDKIRSLAEWMVERGLSREDLLQQTVFDTKVFDAILNGRYTPSPQQRQRLAGILGLQPDQISWGHTAPVEHIYGHGPQFGRSP
jgi:hypothetical protein